MGHLSYHVSLSAIQVSASIANWKITTATKTAIKVPIVLTPGSWGGRSGPLRLFVAGPDRASITDEGRRGGGFVGRSQPQPQQHAHSHQQGSHCHFSWFEVVGAVSLPHSVAKGADRLTSPIRPPIQERIQKPAAARHTSPIPLRMLSGTVSALLQRRQWPS